MNFDLEDPVVEIMESTFGLTKIEQVQVDFRRYDSAVKEMQAKAHEAQIVDDASNQMVVSMAGQASAMLKAIEKRRKEIVADPNEFVKAVNQFAKNYTSALDTIKTILTQKITRYSIEKEKERLERQRLANEQAKALQDEINAAASRVEETPYLVVVPVAIEPNKITRTEGGNAVLTTTWTWEVEDFSKVPDEYKMIDKVGLNKSVKAGLRQIPGVKVYEVQGTRIRAAAMPWNATTTNSMED